MSIKAKKRSINIVTYVLIVFFGLVIFSKPTVYAWGDDNTKQVEWCKTILGGINNAILEAMGLKEGAAGTSPYDACIAADEQFPELKTALKCCGGLLVLIIAISHLFTNLERGVDQVEAVFKVLIEILVAALFIVNLDLLVESVVGFGNWVIETVGNPGEDAAVSTGDCEKLLEFLTGEKTGGFTWRCEANFMLILPYLASLLISLAAKFCVYQAALEIGVRKMFLPLAVADIYQEGLRSPGVRYLKKLLACFLKIAICAAIGLILGVVATMSIDSASTDTFNYLFGQIAISASAVGFMFICGEVANDIVGA